MKKEITIYTQAEKWSFQDEMTIRHTTLKGTTDTNCIYIDLNEQVVEIDIPDGLEDLMVNAEISELEKMRDKIKADSVVKVNAIDDKIKSLLSIENKQGE